ncbi:hypothetical protein CSA37_10850 [Candidatus Fermentibacteria bacterium]|nr:MAG: hypothetical protein CSA37_10850 [Candidatus Fermentibacteria bacterium]
MKPDLLSSAGKLLVHLLGISWRIGRFGPLTGIRKKQVLYGFWHGVQLPLLYTHRNMGIRIMISRSRDGSVVSDVCSRMGYSPVRGSSSRGGMEAARELIRALRTGVPGAITPDGPKGPAHQVKKGVSLIPQRAGVPVVPYGASAFPAIRLKSWDRFMIPLPFARLVVTEGRPVPPEMCTDRVLTRAINQQQRRAELLGRPAPSFLINLWKAAGYLLSPVADLVLLSRAKPERRERMGQIACRDRRPVWLHGASLGELNGLLPVMDKLLEMDIPFHVTCSTVSGRDFLRSRGISCSFMPLDIPKAVSSFLDRLAPSALILAETEFWPLLLYETQKRGIPSAVVNGRLSQKSVGRYKLIKPLFTGILQCFRLVLTRSESDTERYISLGVKAETAGDCKAMVKPPAPSESWKKMIQPGKRGIIVAGSTRRGEEKTVLEIAKALEMNPVLVPRHDDRIEEVLRACKKEGFSPELWSDSPEGSRCLVVDKKGVLSALYGLGDIAFIGGTVHETGGHNILEPLAHKVPVLSGPCYWNIEKEVEQAVNRGVCRVFKTTEEAVRHAEFLLGNRAPDADNKTECFTVNLSRLFRMLELE